MNCKRHKEFGRFAKLNQNSQCYLALFENLNYARCYTMNNFQFICKEQFLWSEILIFLLQVSMLKNYQFVERNLPVSVIRNFKFLFRKTVRFSDQKLSISFFKNLPFSSKKLLISLNRNFQFLFKKLLISMIRIYQFLWSETAHFS